MTRTPTIKEIEDAINVTSDEEQSQFWELLMSTGQWMSFAFGRRAANDAMAVLYLGALDDRNSNTESEQDWTFDEPQWRRQLYDAALAPQLKEGFENIENFFSLCDWQDLWKTFSGYWNGGFGDRPIDRIFQLLH